MGNIRSMFLIEAGFIGFVGGVAGVILSYGVSFLINKFLAGALLYGMSSKLSMIPPWLGFASHRFCHIDWYAGRILPGAQSHETESAGGNQE